MAYWKNIGRSKDFWSGVIFLALGCAAVSLGRDHPMGTAMRMGPAYFPTMLGLLLRSLGLGIALIMLVILSAYASE